MPNRGLLDAGMLRNVNRPTDRNVLGMPVPVWTLAFWFAGALIVDVVSFVFPVDVDAAIVPRVIGAVVAVAVIAVLVVLGERTPTWFLHLMLVVAIGFMVWFAASAMQDSGALITMLTMLVLAGYVAYTMILWQAVAYVTASSAGILAAFAVADRGSVLFLAWAIVTVMCFTQVMILGTLVADLKQQVVIDPLTGLLNRAGLELVVSGPAGHERLPEPRAIVVIDLDDLKTVNDEHGHAEGDRVLTAVGDTILGMCRKDDIAVRCGGDEFILLPPNTDETSALAFARRLEAEAVIACSTGVTSWAGDEELHLAIARADRLMYQTKAARRAERQGT